VRLTENSRGANICGTKNEIYSSRLHERMVFLSIGVTLAVKLPTIGDA
jgi:hypothetical protein